MVFDGLGFVRRLTGDKKITHRTAFVDTHRDQTGAALAIRFEAGKVLSIRGHEKHALVGRTIQYFSNALWCLEDCILQGVQITEEWLLFLLWSGIREKKVKRPTRAPQWPLGPKFVRV